MSIFVSWAGLGLAWLGCVVVLLKATVPVRMPICQVYTKYGMVEGRKGE